VKNDLLKERIFLFLISRILHQEMGLYVEVFIGFGIIVKIEETKLAKVVEKYRDDVEKYDDFCRQNMGSGKGKEKESEKTVPKEPEFDSAEEVIVKYLNDNIIIASVDDSLKVEPDKLIVALDMGDCNDDVVFIGYYFQQVCDTKSSHNNTIFAHLDLKKIKEFTNGTGSAKEKIEQMKKVCACIGVDEKPDIITISFAE
jgi:hypothetical protein